MSFILLGILNSQVAGGGAGGPAYDLLATTTPTGNSVVFNNLDTFTDYKHLQIRYAGRANSGDNSIQLYMRFNSSSSGYAYHTLSASQSGLTINSGASTSTTFIEPSQIVGGNQPSGIFSVGVIDILDFAANDKNTTTRSLAEYLRTDDGGQLNFASGLWNSTAAVTRIELYLNAGRSFLTGSRVSIYGVR